MWAGRDRVGRTSKEASETGSGLPTIIRGMGRDLIHRRLRIEMREFCVGFGTLRFITDAFNAEGFVEGSPVHLSGERRSLFESYENNIDWTNPEQATRALRVFEDMLSWSGDNTRFSEEFLPKVLQRLPDGFLIDDRSRIRRTDPWPLTELPLDQLSDPSAVEEYFARLNTAGETDPPLAISYAKSLLEATTKLVLEELGHPYEPNDDLPTLAKAAQKALKVHTDVIAPTKRGRETILAALGNLSQVAIRVAELRNEYGIAHGHARPSYTLGPRHAHLVVGMVSVYCRFLLETLSHRRSQPPDLSG